MMKMKYIKPFIEVLMLDIESILRPLHNRSVYFTTCPIVY